MVNDPNNPNGGGAPVSPFAAPFQFTPQDYNVFATNTGFGYGNWSDQLKDAFSMPGRGAGVFMGNQAPRYGTPAPNLTFPGGFQGLLAQGAPGMAPRAPAGGPAGSGLLGMGGPAAPRAANGGGPVMPPSWAPPVPQGVPFSGGGNYSINPNAASLANEQFKWLAQSDDPNDAMKLSALAGPEEYHRLQNYYHAGGQGHDPQGIQHRNMIASGFTQGIQDLAGPTRAYYESQGIISNGKWAKQPDPNGNWVPVGSLGGAIGNAYNAAAGG